jgi:hypothetical protein
MKTLINILLVLTLFTSCRTQKYDSGYKEEMEYYKNHPIVEKERIPCINRVYCNKALERTMDDYRKKNLFLVEVIETGFQYKLCLETNSVFSIDTTTEFIVDTLQYHCPIY